MLWAGHAGSAAEAEGVLGPCSATSAKRWLRATAGMGLVRQGNKSDLPHCANSAARGRWVGWQRWTQLCSAGGFLAAAGHGFSACAQAAGARQYDRKSKGQSCREIGVMENSPEESQRSNGPWSPKRRWWAESKGGAEERGKAGLAGGRPTKGGAAGVRGPNWVGLCAGFSGKRPAGASAGDRNGEKRRGEKLNPREIAPVLDFGASGRGCRR